MSPSQHRVLKLLAEAKGPRQISRLERDCKRTDFAVACRLARAGYAVWLYHSEAHASEYHKFEITLAGRAALGQS